MARRRAALQAFSLFSFQDIITSVTGIMVLVLLVLALELVQSQFATPAVQNEVVSNQAEEMLQEVQEQIKQLEERLAITVSADDPTLSPVSFVAQEGALRAANLQQARDLKAKQLKTQSLEKQNQASKQALANSLANKQKMQQISAKQAEILRKRAQLKNGERLIYNPGRNLGKNPWLVQFDEGRILVAPGERQQQIVTFSGSNTTQIASFLVWSRKRSPSTDYFLLLVKPGTVDVFEQVDYDLATRGFSIGIDLISGEQNAIDPDADAQTQDGE